MSCGTLRATGGFFMSRRKFIISLAFLFLAACAQQVPSVSDSPTPTPSLISTQQCSGTVQISSNNQTYDVEYTQSNYSDGSVKTTCTTGANAGSSAYSTLDGATSAEYQCVIDLGTGPNGGFEMVFKNDPLNVTELQYETNTTLPTTNNVICN
jgi:hypothetical protein